MSPINNAKRNAAIKAVNDNVRDNTIIGIGSGSTIVYAVERLSKLVETNNLNVACVPTSYQARQLIREHNLRLTDLDSNPVLDLVIDGADEFDRNLTLIKGGGGCQLQEKIVASCSGKLIIIADHTKKSEKLGDNYKKGIPIEIVPLAYVPVKNKIEKEFGGKAYLREGQSKAGPCVTDGGNLILDWVNYNQDYDWKEVNNKIQMIPGVIETGLFVGMASKIYLGMEDGTVTEIQP